MKPYGKEFYLKKKVSDERQKIQTKYPNKISKQSFQFIHQIFDTINISLLILIFILFFLSFDSQREWSNTYKNLSKTKSMNNNLIDYISKTEEFYIGELEALTNFRKTKPKDLIYIERIKEKKESFLKKKSRILIEGFNDSKF